MKNFAAIELFAGAGGLGIGIARSGFSPHKIVEIDDYCRTTIALNRCKKSSAINDWPTKIECDVRLQDFTPYADKVDLVSGGPPCQPFSMGGKHHAYADKRDMFPEAVRAVRQCRPKAFLFENVKGLTRQSFAAYFEYIRLQLCHPHIVSLSKEAWHDHLRRLQKHHTSHRQSSDDYRVVTQVMNAADYGVPQQRHRVFFVGIRSDLGKEYAFRSPTHSKEMLVGDLASGAYMERNKITRRNLSVPRQVYGAISGKKHNQNLDASLKPWKTVREALADLPDPKTKSSKMWLNHDRREGAKSYPGHTGSDLDFPAKTLKAGVHGVPGGENMLRYQNGSVRYFTVRESARLQTFPDDYEISGSWSEAMRQLGNAVPVELAQIVAEDVRKALLS